jgi:hypothetical protein
VNERNAMNLKSGYSRPQHVQEFISHLQVDLYYWNRDRIGLSEVKETNTVDWQSNPLTRLQSTRNLKKCHQVWMGIIEICLY